ncbi:MAG: hypothetical protein WC510_05350 [Candidatus Omnitrophota bacterium]
MKIVSMFMIAALTLLVPVFASADIALTVSAQVTPGTSMGQHTVLECTGYNYVDTGNPWTQCLNKGAIGSLDFGALTQDLKDTAGNIVSGAGCWYAEKFFIVYLFPNAWGGATYTLSQNPAALPSPVDNAMVFTPVYADQDQFCWGTPQTCQAQGVMNAYEHTQNDATINKSQLARNGGLIFKGQRARIVRAQYGIPPIPATGDTRPAGWTAIPLETAQGTYTAGVTITMVSS